MWGFGNIACCAVTALGLMSGAMAQPAPGDPAPVGGEAADAAPGLDVNVLPGAPECLDAFRTVESWVRAWKVPEADATLEPANCHGVCVTLRLAGAAGRTLARGIAWSDPRQDRNALWRATRAALIEAEPKLKLPNDATRDEARTEIAARVLLDIQFAGTPVPIAGDTIEAASATLNPGRHGVMARVRVVAAGAAGPEPAEGSTAVFPGSMLSMGLTPGRALAVALGEMNAAPVSLKELREKSSIEVYRFEVRHAAQVKPGAGPEMLYRGGNLVPMQAVDSQGLREFAAAMADHLSSRRWRGAGAYGLRGNYDPLRDVYTPSVAGPREQAVAALALLRFARTPGVDRDAVGRANETALIVLDQLMERAEGEEDPLAPTAAAAWLIAATEAGWCGVPGPGEAGANQRRTAFRDAALAAVRAQVKVVEDDGVERAEWAPPPGTAAALTPGERSMLTLALARTAGEDAAALKTARLCVRGLFKGTEPGALVALMPWLAWSELEMSSDESAPVPSGEALRQLRALCWSRQLSATQAGENPDLAGGIVFSGGPASAQESLSPDPSVWPTWQTLRPLAMMGGLLADKRLTSDEELRQEVLSLLGSLRFVRQLAVDESAAHMFRDPSRALGGIRPAVWETTALLDGTSMALLSVCEALRGAEARSE